MLLIALFSATLELYKVNIYMAGAIKNLRIIRYDGCGFKMARAQVYQVEGHLLKVVYIVKAWSWFIATS
jgi:hypothetical protein